MEPKFNIGEVIHNDLFGEGRVCGIYRRFDRIGAPEIDNFCYCILVDGSYYIYCESDLI